MNIHEYQAKEIFAGAGLAVPRGQVCTTPDQAEQTAVKMNCPVVVKAQVHAGGRGKAGGVKLARNPGEARTAGEKIIGMVIKGLTVEKVLVEEALDIQKEYYLGITLDRSRGQNVMIFSPVGGMDIEEVARTNPEMIFREPVDPLMGLGDFQKRNLAFCGHVPSEGIKSLMKFMGTLYDIYCACDCTLSEINPLVFTGGKCFIAADGKINIDDSALYRQKDLLKYQEIAQSDPIEAEARQRNIAYVRLSGDIGIIGNGAGLVMCTLDMVDRAGGRVANFLDIGGGAKADKVRQSVELVLMDPGVRGLFINIFGGITRCDEVARGLVEGITGLKVKIPVVIRLCGTNEKEGRHVLSEAGFDTVDTMLEGAGKIVALSANALK